MFQFPFLILFAVNGFDPGALTATGLACVLFIGYAVVCIVSGAKMCPDGGGEGDLPDLKAYDEPPGIGQNAPGDEPAGPGEGGDSPPTKTSIPVLMPVHKQPGPIPPGVKENFETLRRAFTNGDVALMSCLEKDTNRQAYVICTVVWADGEYHFTPFAEMEATMNPFDRYVPPAAPSNGTHYGHEEKAPKRRAKAKPPKKDKNK